MTDHTTGQLNNHIQLLDHKCFGIIFIEKKNTQKQSEINLLLNYYLSINIIAVYLIRVEILLQLHRSIFDISKKTLN